MLLCDEHHPLLPIIVCLLKLPHTDHDCIKRIVTTCTGILNKYTDSNILNQYILYMVYIPYLGHILHRVGHVGAMHLL